MFGGSQMTKTSFFKSLLKGDLKIVKDQDILPEGSRRIFPASLGAFTFMISLS